MAGISSGMVNLVQRLLPARWMKRYELFIYASGINFLAAEYLVVSFLMGLISALLVEFVSQALYALVVFLAVFLGMALGYPYWRVSKRIDEMEKMLPDAFFYLASSLRAGISFSEALEELTTAKFGALTDEFKKTVAEIKKGRPTVDALKAFAIRNKRSSVIYRSMMIIIEALERGAPMSDVLVYVGNDVREILRIKQERKASTGMQMMFFIITSGFIGPLILGVVCQVMESVGSGFIVLPVDTIRLILLAFVSIQALISGLGIGVIREGKYSAGLKYSLLLVVMGVGIFQTVSTLNIQGGFGL
ncbi:type II secretion system F family protein [Thermococcus sp. 21S7]|uniref:type II secretion system F family protein n=1 Tax=Thermococcus sp. 21S7 TaxID=1638221 RepID=UPI0014388AD8|nr:type II secretion system F family protein [Thermococcus sp. 21S7]NJE61820.1 type II secretion system F family protein [Thermococcus sp. 21S7]